MRDFVFLTLLKFCLFGTIERRFLKYICLVVCLFSQTFIPSSYIFTVYEMENWAQTVIFFKFDLHFIDFRSGLHFINFRSGRFYHSININYEMYIFLEVWSN